MGKVKSLGVAGVFISFLCFGLVFSGIIMEDLNLKLTDSQVKMIQSARSKTIKLQLNNQQVAFLIKNYPAGKIKLSRATQLRSNISTRNINRDGKMKLKVSNVTVPLQLQPFKSNRVSKQPYKRHAIHLGRRIFLLQLNPQQIKLIRAARGAAVNITFSKDQLVSLFRSFLVDMLNTPGSSKAIVIINNKPGTMGMGKLNTPGSSKAIIIINNKPGMGMGNQITLKCGNAFLSFDIQK